MDMKKILQAFDGAATKKPVQGANDMKKFLSIVKENANPYTPTQESVITSFEEGSVGGDANAFLLAADTIQDEVMAQVNKIKINADEASLRDMMDKFNAFMTAYHNVGKGILQPDMFNDSMGESTEEQVDEAGAFRRPSSPTAYDRDYASSVSGMGKRDSLAYQQDGGANDEGWGEEPRSSYPAGAQAKTRMVGMFFYNVPAGKEQEAASLGVKQTKSGKWAKTKYNTSGRTFNMQKDLADKAFGVGKWWAPKTESVAEDSESMTPNWAKYVVKQIYNSNGAVTMTDLFDEGIPGLHKMFLDVAAELNLDPDEEFEEVQSEVLERLESLTKGHGVEESIVGLSFKDYVNLAEAKKGLE